MPINVVIKESNKNKRFMAIFRKHKGGDVIKITHFGQKNPKKGTFIDGRSDKDKENYLKRHKPRENWDRYMTAGSLSRYILWNKKTFDESLKDYKKRFKLS